MLPIRLLLRRSLPRRALCSNLKDIARQIGQIGPDYIESTSHQASTSGMAGPAPMAALIATIHSLQLHEAWDLLEAMKKLVMGEKRGNKLREMVEQHPQLIPAMYEIQVRVQDYEKRVCCICERCHMSGLLT